MVFLKTKVWALKTPGITRGNSRSSIFFEPPDIFDCERYSKRNGTLVKYKQKHTDTNSISKHVFVILSVYVCKQLSVI